MKICCTTSDRYHHLLKIFIYLFNHNWSDTQEVEVVGYKKPDFDFPANFTFYSMGDQTDTNKDFSNDLRKYFERQDQWFIWIFEDSWIRGVDFKKLEMLKSLIHCIDKVGRINLTNDVVKHSYNHYADLDSYPILRANKNAIYRLSTQPSIWNKQFLLENLKPDLNPWDFETQNPVNDGWEILGLDNAAIDYNEGVCKKDIYDYDLNKIKEEQIEEMKQLGIL